MKKNTLFLVLGLTSTILSKFLQFYTSSKIGDIIVLFSGAFFVCAILFSNSKFNMLYQNDKNKGIVLLIQSVLIVLLFQLMMILIINKMIIGLVLILPILILIYITYPKLMKLFK